MMNRINRLIQTLPKEAQAFLPSTAELSRVEAGIRPQSAICLPGWCVPLALCPPHRALTPDWRHLCSQKAETVFALIPWVSSLLKRAISLYPSPLATQGRGAVGTSWSSPSHIISAVEEIGHWRPKGISRTEVTNTLGVGCEGFWSCIIYSTAFISYIFMSEASHSHQEYSGL